MKCRKIFYSFRLNLVRVCLIKTKYRLIIAIFVPLICLLAIVTGVAYLVANISYIPEKIDDIENSTPYVPHKIANSIIQHLPYVEGILFGFNGLIFVHLMSSLKSEQGEAVKGMDKAEMEQFKYVAEEKSFSSKSSSRRKIPKPDYDLLIQICQNKMDGYVRIYEDISRTIKVNTAIEIITLFSLMISVLTTFLAFGKINETFGLDAVTFMNPVVFVLVAFFSNSIMIVGLAVTRPIEHVYVYFEKEQVKE